MTKQEQLIRRLRETPKTTIKAESPRASKPSKAKVKPVVFMGDKSAQMRLLKDIKDQKKFVPPPLKSHGERVCWVLNELAVHYPKVVVPYTYITMILHALTAVPRADGQKVLETRKAIPRQRKSLREKYDRDLLYYKEEAAVRATVDADDFLPLAIQQNKKVEASLRTKQEIDALFNVDEVSETPANKELIAWHKRFTLIADKIAKQLPSNTDPTPKKS